MKSKGIEVSFFLLKQTKGKELKGVEFYQVKWFIIVVSSGLTWSLSSKLEVNIWSHLVSSGLIWLGVVMMYRYRLAVYGREYKSKGICPQCRQRTFVPMVDTMTGELLWDYGRCDREKKCGFYRQPMGEERGRVERVVEVVQKKQSEKPLGAKYNLLPNDDYSNPLYSFLLKYFNEEAVVKAFDLYNIRFWSGRVWFPQIDKKGIVWTAKGIVYKEDGHRDKDKPPTWLHCWEGFKGVPNKAFFGEHLGKGNKDVFVVESEKTALVGSIFFDFEFVFIATGGKHGLKRLDLSSNRVYLIPDADAIEDWKAISKEGWVVIDVRSFLKKSLGLEGEFDGGLDLADCIIEYLRG